jgi:Family of unknown function (DUF6526)
MSTQTYANHPHRPVMTFVASGFWLIALMGLISVWKGGGSPGWGRVLFDAGVLGTLLVLISISRVYITRLQDRIIRLEVRMRGAGLLSAEQQRMLAALDLKRLAALRFASDAELPALVERASRESLKPDEIKRAIQHWVGDFDRT